VVDFLYEFQEKYNNITDSEVKKILADGAKKASVIAAETMKKVRANLGII